MAKVTVKLEPDCSKLIEALKILIRNAENAVRELEAVQAEQDDDD